MDVTKGWNKEKIINGAAGVFLICAIFGAGFYAGRGARNPADEVAGVANTEAGKPAVTDFAQFWEVWNLLDDKFVPTVSPGATSTKDLTSDEKMWGAIAGLTKSLGDPYTVFLDPEQTKIFESDMNGNFEGVGMEIGVKDGLLTVIAPLKGTPAEKAGLVAGDKIVTIDGESSMELSVDEAVSKIRGPKGTEVKLGIIGEDDSETREVEITRDVIVIPTIDTEVKSMNTGGGKAGGKASGAADTNEKVFVIRLHNFGASSPNDFRNALRDFVDSGKDKLIIDLRGNPGGYLEAATDIASWFLPMGEPVVTEKFGNESDDIVHRSKGYNIFNDSLKMVVLVDKGSASASEILAGALQEYGKAKLVGEQTFGKGSVQELLPVGSASLKVTVARWYTPNGKSISVSGLAPDYAVAITKEDAGKGRDPQFEKASEVLLEMK